MMCYFVKISASQPKLTDHSLFRDHWHIETIGAGGFKCRGSMGRWATYSEGIKFVAKHEL